MATIYEELVDVTGVKRKDGEGEQEFMRRLFSKANQMKDDAWDQLTGPAQKWCNAAGTAIEEKTEIPTLGPMTNGTAEPDKAKPAKAKKAAAAKPAKAAAPAKDKPVKAKAAKDGDKEKGEGRGRKGSYPLEAKIVVKAKENPHRETSKDFEKFTKLKKASTVEKAIAAGIDWGYLRYGVKKDLIAIG